MTTASSPAATAPAAQLSALQPEVRRVLAAYGEQPGNAGVWRDLVSVRRALAETIASLPTAQKGGAAVELACALLQEFEQSGAADQPVSAEDLALAEDHRKRSWPGLLASMLLVPAWQAPAAPRIADVPMWLWAEYTAYLFYTPQGFSACGQAEAYAGHYLRRLPELVQLAESNRGSAAVRNALQTYLAKGNCIPLYFSSDSLRRHYELRGRILTLAAGGGRQEEIVPLPREGRRLRVGFINRHFGPQTETYTTLPMFEQLDPERFEVILFAHRRTETPLEAYACSRAEFRLLPEEVDAQVQLLRDAQLDVVVFGTNVTAVYNEVARLALYRVAPLQLVNNSSCTTSGLPEVDMYVSGTLTESPEASAHFTERLGLLPGPAHAFNYEADKQEPTTQWTREALQIPQDAVVFVSAANYYKITPEMQHAWAKLLAAVPGSRLLVHPFNPNWSSTYPINRFCAEFDRVIAEHGVGSEQLIVSTAKFPSRVDVRQLLSVGDIYLDTFPFGGVNSLIDPLEAGIPAIVWEGETFRSRMGAALLRSLGLDELIATNAEGYHALAVRVATDAAWRTGLKQRIATEMEKPTVFFDTLAASDAFGALIETAYNEILAMGVEAFKKERTPLTVPVEADPVAALSSATYLLEMGLNDEAEQQVSRILGACPRLPEARRLFARILTAKQRHGRAAEYLIAAIQDGSSSPAHWRDLAGSLENSGNFSAAVSALETAVKIDPKDAETWFHLGEVARKCGHTEMLTQIVSVLEQLAPEDARLQALRGCLNPVNL